MGDYRLKRIVAIMKSGVALSHQAGICLMCACENDNNRLARLLLQRAGALSATGVVAAVFIADSNEREQLLFLSRGAIAEQRDSCLRAGLFAAHRCPDSIRRKTGTDDSEV